MKSRIVDIHGDRFSDTLLTFFQFFTWPLGILAVTFCISENRGRIKAWFDAQGRVQTYWGLVYIVVTMVVSTFTYLEYYINFYLYLH